MMKCFFTHLVAAALTAFAVPATSLDLFVDPNGKDAWSGTRQFPNESENDGPFKTLERAQQAIRSLKKNGGLNEAIQVNIADGVYYLEHALLFNDADSGMPGKGIVWQPQPGAEVTLSGGIPVFCNTGDDKLWHCPFLKVPFKTDSIDNERIQGNTPNFDVYIGDQRMTLARWPDRDWAYVKHPLDEKSRFSAMEALPKPSDDLSYAQLHIFPGNDWYDQYVGIDAIDTAANAITTATPVKYKLQAGRRFYLRNLRSLLNMPGEWYYDRQAKELSLIPLDGAGPNTAIISALPNVLIADRTSNVSFKRLKFKHSTDTAVIIKNADSVILDGVEIGETGGKGLDIRGGQNVTLANSKIYDTGTQGLAVSGGDRNNLISSRHQIHNNHIRNSGEIILTYSPNIEVSGVGTKIDHNLLEQSGGTGLLIKGNEHLIEKNEIHHFCLQSADCGAIYTVRDWTARGNVIRNNYIHDIPGYGLQEVDTNSNRAIYRTPDYSMGIYLDDGASGFDVSANILKNAGATSLYIHGGRDNHFYNNYIITDRSAIWISKILTPNYNWNQNQERLDNSPYKSELWQHKYPELARPMQNKTLPEGNRIDHNVIISENSNNSLFRYWLPKSSSILENNIVWSTSNQITLDYNITEQNVRNQNASWQQWVSEGIEKNSAFINPCINFIEKSLVPCENSPIFDKNIPLPQNDIGLHR